MLVEVKCPTDVCQYGTAAEALKAGKVRHKEMKAIFLLRR